MDYSTLWDVRIMLDLFLGGAGAGLLVFLAFEVRVRGEATAKTLKAGLTLALLLVAAGALCLMTELGRPLNAFSILVGFNATSIVAWGSIIQAVFLLSTLILVIMLFKDNAAAFDKLAFKVAGVLSILLAATLLVYHGLTLNVSGNGLWANGLVVPLFAASSLVVGAGLGCLVDTLTGKVFTCAVSRGVLAAALANALFVVFFGFGVAPAGLEAMVAYAALMQASGVIWWLVAVVVGALAPLVLALVFAIRPNAYGMAGIVALAVCTIAGSFAAKYLIASSVLYVIG